MKALLPLIFVTSALSSPAFAQKEAMTETANAHIKPPVAAKRPHQTTHHGVTITDDYHWLRDASYPTIDDKEILDHLKAENAYFEAQMAPQAELIETIFQEMKGRVKEDDSSVPQKDGAYIYWSKFEEGAQYRKHYRKPVAGGADQLILDENELAKGKAYFRLGAAEISPDGKILAYAYDDNGSERFDLHFRNLETGEKLADIIPGTLSSIVCSSDN
jgi:oligopeptidase B